MTAKISRARAAELSGGSGVNRRAFLRAGGAALAGGATLAGGIGHAYAADSDAPGGRYRYQPSQSCDGVDYRHGTMASTIARTTSGRIRGLFNGKAHVFKGIPYGAPTSGERRFMAPQKPAPWSGVLDTVELGQQSPQLTFNLMAEELISLDNSPQGEDCLRLNVWTPAVGDGGRRPVMVWFHGGGFSGGSGGDVRYDGSNLANKHGTVVVTVNERLNAFGFLYLGDIGGAKYADSGNAGLLDLVASLRWVHDNISEFGGDPANVTIFGQSGGGGKVTTLMATPAAKGLFHRAIAESGLNIEAIPANRATDSAKELMARLHLKPNQVDELQRLPVDSILAAMNGIQHSRSTGGGFLAFGPIIDHRTLFNHPWDPVAPSVSRDVPLILGSNLCEVTFGLAAPRDPIDEAMFQDLVEHHMGFGGNLSATPEEASQLIALYRRAYPGVHTTRLYQIMASDNLAVEVHTVAERKALLGAAPAFVYHFEWITPVEGGRLGTPHTLEIPFAFDNMDVPTVDIVTGAGPDRQPLADKLSRAWTGFARSGNPSHPGIPHWEPFSAAHRAVMIINNDWRLETNPHEAEYAAITQLMARTRQARAARAQAPA